MDKNIVDSEVVKGISVVVVILILILIYWYSSENFEFETQQPLSSPRRTNAFGRSRILATTNNDFTMSMP